MKITEIAFTGYSVTDMKRAKSFYEGMLGLTKSRGFREHEGDEQWVEYDIGAGCLALISGGGDKWPPHPAGTAAAFEADDFDGYVTKLRDGGANIIMGPLDGPVCRMLVVADPDTNWVVIHQRKTTHPDTEK